MSSDSSLSDMSWVFESKFEPNRPRSGLVRRDRLLGQIHEGARRKLCLIVAPAGYGKSSLLGQWVVEAEQQGVRYAWLTLESGEEDEKQFLAYVVLLLSRAGMGLEELETGARDGFADAAISAVLPKLIRIINGYKERFVLIFEDFHNAECEAVNAIVKQLIRDTVSNFTIFIDTRRQPDIDAFALIASGDAIEIGAAQLRMTRQETLEVLGNIADEAGCNEIFEQTEGWPVAVQLALVQKQAQPLAPILAGVDGGFIASYLTEQILSTLGADAQEFLLAVAFLGRFNSELTNYVLESEGAWGRVDSLSSLAPFIVPLDVSSRWYRLHHLFAEYLQEMQTRRNQSWGNKILLRASEWYSEKKQTVEAVRYAARAGAYDECEKLILDAGGWKIILNEGIGILRNSLRLLPEDVIASSSRLSIARAYLHCKHGEISEARAMLNAAVQIEDIEAPKLRDTDQVVVESMINLYEDRLEWTQDHSQLRDLYDNEEGLDALGRGTIRCEDVLIHIARGELGKADACLREVFSLMRQSGSVLGLNYCYNHASHIALYRGDFAAAAANVDRANKMADENFGSDSGLKIIASVLSYSLQVWRGDAEKSDLEGFKDTLIQAAENDGWVELYIAGLAALALLDAQCGDGSATREIIDKLRLRARQLGLRRLELFVDCVEFSNSWRQVEVHGEAPQHLSSFLDSFRYEDAKENWQSYVILVLDPALTDSAAVSSGSLASAQKLVTELGAGLWSFTLRLATVKILRATGQLDDAKQELLNTLKDAIPLRVMGPFLADLKILDFLSELRSDLRHDESELIALQFVNDILDRAKVFRPSKRAGPLSEREYEVLLKLADGMSNKEIARSLELTENTVKFHLKSLFSKLAVSKRTQAILEAQRRNLID